MVSKAKLPLEMACNDTALILLNWRNRCLNPKTIIKTK